MMRFVKQILITIVFFVSWSSTVSGSEVQFVRGMMQVLSQQDPIQIRSTSDVDSVRNWFDFGALFERATLDFRSQLKPEDLKGLKALFEELMVKNMVKNAHRLKDRALTAIRYSLLERKPGYSVVVLTGRSSDVDIRMDFILHTEGTAFKIVDLNVNGALLSRNYRGQLNRIYRVEGVDGLTRRMQEKVASRH